MVDRGDEEVAARHLQDGLGERCRREQPRRAAGQADEPGRGRRESGRRASSVTPGEVASRSPSAETHDGAGRRPACRGRSRPAASPACRWCASSLTVAARGGARGLVAGERVRRRPARPCAARSVPSEHVVGLRDRAAAPRGGSAARGGAARAAARSGRAAGWRVRRWPRRRRVVGRRRAPTSRPRRRRPTGSPRAVLAAGTAARRAPCGSGSGRRRRGRALVRAPRGAAAARGAGWGRGCGTAAAATGCGRGLRHGLAPRAVAARRRDRPAPGRAAGPVIGLDAPVARVRRSAWRGGGRAP